MIDLALLRQDPQRVRDLVRRKEPSFNIDLLIALDKERRGLQQELDTLRAQKNEFSKQARGGINQDLRAQSNQLSQQIKEKETQSTTVEQQFYELYASCPNIVSLDVPLGDKDQNKVVKTWGSKPEFNFAIKNHVELGTQLDWLDFHAASIIAGANLALYKKDAVKMIYALTMMMLKNNIKFGYEPILPPYLVNEKSLFVASNFPKFKDQVFTIGLDNLYLTPTAEVDLTSMYRDQILSASQLPIRMTAWTSCFRREAGSYGAHERGLIRMHQFEKVELYTLCEPQNSEQEQERMIACAESILQQLGLHYRISLLAAQDCSFPSAKTYDIEVWLPGQDRYYEVSSISNCTDFQARRGMIRYRVHPDSKPELVHTLNGSSLALSRLMVALLEVYQQPDGTVYIPDVLRKEGIF